LEHRCVLESQVISWKAYVVPARAVVGIANVAATELVAHHRYFALKIAFEPVGQVVPVFDPKWGSEVGGVDVNRKCSLAAVLQCTATFVPGMTAIAVLRNCCTEGGVATAPAPVGTAATAVTARIAPSLT